MYKVIDVAKLFSVSKVTIYKKITNNKDALKGHVIKKKNVTYLDDEAVEIIKASLQMNQEKASGRLIDEELEKVYDDIKMYQELNHNLKAEKIAMLNDEIMELESLIRHLNSQVLVKTNHLSSKNEILDKFKKILKTNKLLIKKLDHYASEFKVV
jgi:ATP-dependent Lon protease